MTILDSLIAADDAVAARLGIEDIDAEAPTPAKFDNRPTWDNWERKNWTDWGRWLDYDKKK